MARLPRPKRSSKTDGGTPDLRQYSIERAGIAWRVVFVGVSIITIVALAGAVGLTTLYRRVHKPAKPPIAAPQTASTPESTTKPQGQVDASGPSSTSVPNSQADLNQPATSTILIQTGPDQDL